MQQVVSGNDMAMVEWLKRFVSDGNVIRERSYTNWNTLDVNAIVAEKEREVLKRAPTPETSASPARQQQNRK